MEISKLFATKPFAKARGEVYTCRVKSHYNDDKIIFFGSNNNNNNKSVYKKEASGLILEKSGNYKILAYPPANLFKLSVDKPNQLSIVRKKHQNGDYRVLPMIDGSIITFYYYNKWIVSTNKGYDVADIIWCEYKYSDAISDALKAKGISETDFYASLDKKSSYTFILTHPSFHPVHSEPDLVFSQSINLDEKSPNYLARSCEFGLLDPQIEVKLGMDEMIKKTNSGEVLGYILRSKTHSRDLFEQVSIEGVRMKRIRKLFYIKSYAKLAEATGYDRVDIIILWAFLNDSLTEEFCKFFPRFNDEIKRITKLYEEFVKDVVGYMLTDKITSTDEHTIYVIKKVKLDVNAVIPDITDEKTATFHIKTYVRHTKLIEMLFPIFMGISTKPTPDDSIQFTKLTTKLSEIKIS